MACQSNQRQLAIAVQMYADAGDGLLPCYLPDDPTAAGRAVSSPIKTYRVAYSDDPAVPVRPANHGVLFSREFAPAPGVFYCPEKSAELWQEPAYPRPWLSAGTPGETADGTGSATISLVRSSYPYNPIRKIFNGPPLGREFRRYEKLSQMRPDDSPVPWGEPFLRELPLFMDLLVGSRHPTVAHDENTAWNVALPDGSVRKYVDAETAENHKKFESLNWATFGVFLGRVLENG